MAITPFALATTQKTTAKKTTASKSTAKKTTTHVASKSRHGKRTMARKKSWKSRGQQAISTDRAREIQEALIREHYLDGEPTGVWDARTQAACRKYQGDNGWQTKVLPDSRLLIKLGLGPDHSKVLNPKTAAVGPLESISEPGGSSERSTQDIEPATASIR